MPVRFYRDDSRRVSHSSNGVKVFSEGFRPCGYCMDCRLSKAQSTAIRLMHESRFHDTSSFLTLTYSPDKVPSNSSLCYDDVSDFMKRLRRRLSRDSRSVMFYRVGEYGENFSRPHYHLILFGYDFSEPIRYKGVINSKVLSGKKDDRSYYKSTFLTDCWSNGFADVGDFNYSSAMYVAKYVTKKLYGRNSYHDLLPERSSSSKGNKRKDRPQTSFPIGHRWIEQFYTDVYPHDYVIFNGSKFPPPRYYDDWLSVNHPSLYSQVMSSRQDRFNSIYPDLRDLHARHVLRRDLQSKFLRDGCAPNLSLDTELISRKFDLLTDISKGNL